MEVKVKRCIALGMGLLFFVIGVICYAAFPQQAPEQPVRIDFTNTAGNVLFDHDRHLSDSGYGLSCEDCHHEDPDDPQPCSECHNADSDVGLTDALHQNCKGCHEEESGPVQCSGCHAS